VVSSAATSATATALALAASGTPIGVAGSAAGTTRAPTRAAATRMIRARDRRGCFRRRIQRFRARALTLRMRPLTGVDRAVTRAGPAAASTPPTTAAAASSSLARPGSILRRAALASGGRAIAFRSDLVRAARCGRAGLERERTFVELAPRSRVAISKLCGSIGRGFTRRRCATGSVASRPVTTGPLATGIGALSTAAPSATAARSAPTATPFTGLRGIRAYRGAGGLELGTQTVGSARERRDRVVAWCGAGKERSTIRILIRTPGGVDGMLISHCQLARFEIAARPRATRGPGRGARGARNASLRACGGSDESPIPPPSRLAGATASASHGCVAESELPGEAADLWVVVVSEGGVPLLERSMSARRESRRCSVQGSLAPGFPPGRRSSTRLATDRRPRITYRQPRVEPQERTFRENAVPGAAGPFLGPLVRSWRSRLASSATHSGESGPRRCCGHGPRSRETLADSFSSESPASSRGVNRTEVSFQL